MSEQEFATSCRQILFNVGDDDDDDDDDDDGKDDDDAAAAAGRCLHHKFSFENKTFANIEKEQLTQEKSYETKSY